MTLFAAEAPDACLAFRNLRAASNEHTAAGRAHCEDLWRDFATHADANFVREFAVHTHARWFEMYLTVTLLRAGLNVQCPKPGPDVLLTVNGQRIWIEAIAATAGAPGLPDSVPPRVFDGKANNTPVREMALRVRAALAEKATKFSTYLERGTVAAGEPLVVAINIHEIPYAYPDMEPLMKRAFYGIGDLVLSISRETRKVVDSHNQQLTHIAKRSTGAEVGVQPFIDGTMPHVSAVLGSAADCVNLPRHLGDDFLLLPNLTPAVPWPAGAVPLGDEWTFVDAGEDGWTGTRISHPPLA